MAENDERTTTNSRSALPGAGRLATLALALALATAVLGVPACGTDDDGDGSADAGSDTTGDVVTVVDTSGACGVICDGGEQFCPVAGFDPADGLNACTRACQAEWTLEQDCVGPAEFVIECVDANGGCNTLEVETCGNFYTAALAELYDCLGLPPGPR